MTLLAVLGVVIAMAAIALARGALELRRSAAAVQTDVARLTSADVAALVAEGEQVLREKLDVTMPDDLAEAAQKLDTLTRSPRIKDAFAKPELYWHFVKPLGAMMGELIRRHGQARWVDDPEGLLLRVTLRDGRELTSRPFDRVIRHRLSGKPGELRAYVLFAAGPASPTATTEETEAVDYRTSPSPDPANPGHPESAP